jgi:hypothetical protein
MFLHCGHQTGHKNCEKWKNFTIALVEIARRPNFKGLHASQEVNYKLYDTFLVLYFYFETSASEILLIHV